VTWASDANVGRSTFYNHFRDKEDLLESSIRDVVDEGRRTPHITRNSNATYLRDTLPIKTTSRTTIRTPMSVQSHIPPPIHPFP
jgi:AcrR family transcriptional regulator